MKFSELIGRLTEMWLDWMKNNTIARDATLPTSERKVAAEKCEKLIAEEYRLVAQMDAFFEKPKK